MTITKTKIHKATYREELKFQSTFCGNKIQAFVNSVFFPIWHNFIYLFSCVPFINEYFKN